MKHAFYLIALTTALSASSAYAGRTSQVFAVGGDAQGDVSVPLAGAAGDDIAGLPGTSDPSGIIPGDTPIGDDGSDPDVDPPGGGGHGQTYRIWVRHYNRYWIFPDNGDPSDPPSGGPIIPSDQLPDLTDTVDGFDVADVADIDDPMTGPIGSNPPPSDSDGSSTPSGPIVVVPISPTDSGTGPIGSNPPPGDSDGSSTPSGPIVVVPISPTDSGTGDTADAPSVATGSSTLSSVDSITLGSATDGLSASSGTSSTSGTVTTGITIQ